MHVPSRAAHHPIVAESDTTIVPQLRVEPDTTPPKWLLPPIQLSSTAPTPSSYSLFGVPMALPLTLQVVGTAQFGLKGSIIHDANPYLSPSNHRRSHVDYLQRANLRIQGKYSDFLGLDLHLNSEEGAIGRRVQLQMSYTGAAHDFVERVEAGHVRMSSRHPLIDTGRELFGLQGHLRAGPLAVRLMAGRRVDAERRIHLSGSREVVPIEIPGSHYDYGRHFFLSEYFAARYDTALRSLPVVRSTLHIEHIEVWVSSRADGSSVGGGESIIAYPALATEAATPPMGSSATGTPIALAHARRLQPGEYWLQPQLGFISLASPLPDNAYLAVAYSYTLDGVQYTVGDYSAEGSTMSAALLADRSRDPSSPLFGLMMKNGYRFGAGHSDLEVDDLSVQIGYRTPGSSRLEQSIPQGPLAGYTWSQAFGWDVTDSQQRSDRPDGRFDYLPGVTVVPELGVLFLPYRYPLSTVPQRANGGHTSPLPTTYPVYALLYQSSRQSYEQLAVEDRYVITGTLRPTGSTSRVSLGSLMLQPGQVSVLVGTRELQEGSDYQINYRAGEVTIAPHVSGEVDIVVRESAESARAKNVLGVEAEYQLTPHWVVGGTLMGYSEVSGYSRPVRGQEPIHNTISGVYTAYEQVSQGWSERIGHLTGLRLATPSGLSLQAAYASKQSRLTSTDGGVLLDDFDHSELLPDLTSALSWHLGSHPMLPYTMRADTEITEGRALIAWYEVDPVLTLDRMRGQPHHLTQDPMQRADPLVRPVLRRELMPSSIQGALDQNILPVLNISYYPHERGPYHLQPDALDAEGRLAHPEQSWASMMHPIELHDFEAHRVAYIEGWLLDPFYLDPEQADGVMYLDLGQISEQLLPDTMGAAEGAHATRSSRYGRVPLEQPLVYAFDYSGGVALAQQDLGLNGLSSEDERSHMLYRTFLEEIGDVRSSASGHPSGSNLSLASAPLETHPISSLSEAAGESMGSQSWASDRWGVLGVRAAAADPAADDYVHYLSADYDAMQASILRRYKYISGTEGNSSQHPSSLSPYQPEPDVEDIDGDYLRTVEEHYFRYRLELSRAALQVDGERIVSEVIVPHQMPDGSSRSSRWVKVRVPLHHPHSRIGTPRLSDIRMLRLSFTGFGAPIHLRWAGLRPVIVPWSSYSQPIDPEDRRTAQLTITTLGVEEESGREPVPYVSPPGVERRRPQSPVLPPEDERALSLRATGLEPGQAVAAYSSLQMDLRQFEELSLYTHLESAMPLSMGEVELILRIGDDYSANYYEYTLPLQPTEIAGQQPPSVADLAEWVWPARNTMHLPTQLLTELKQRRDAAGGSITIPFSSDGLQPGSRITIVGAPSIGRVAHILIGFRSRASITIDAEVWVNELRAIGAAALGGDALHLAGRIHMGDFVDLSVEGGYRGAGFGALQDDDRYRIQERLDYYSIRGALQLGKLLPERVGLQAPVAFRATARHTTPRYDPDQSDLLYDPQSHHGDTYIQTQEWSLTDWRILRRPDTPARLLDLANLSLSYQLKQQRERSAEVDERWQRTAHTTLAYSYEPSSGTYLRLHSDWRRRNGSVRYRDAESTTRDARWDWQRGLSARTTILGVLTIGVDSQTTALIADGFTAPADDSPRDAAHHHTAAPLSASYQLAYQSAAPLSASYQLAYQSAAPLSASYQLAYQSAAPLTDPPLTSSDHRAAPLSFSPAPASIPAAATEALPAFRLIGRESWQALTRLGDTDRAHTSTDIIFRLPQLHSRALAPLQFTTSWHSTYDWQRGASISGVPLGHRLSASHTIDLKLRYLFGLLFAAPERAPLRDLTLDLKQSSGMQLPSYTPTAGKAFGIAYAGEHAVTPLPLLLGWSDYRRSVLHAIESGLTGATDGDTYRPPSYYRYTEGRFSLSITPISGLRLQLMSDYSMQQHTTLYSVGDVIRPQGRGAVRLSTMGLRRWHTFGMRGGTYQSDLLDQLSEALSTGADLPLLFLQSHTLLPRLQHGLPAPLMALLPNWDITLELTELLPSLGRSARTLRLRHHYRGAVDLPEYRLSAQSIDAADQLPTILTLTQSDIMAPLIGVETVWRMGLEIAEELNVRRYTTLLTNASRLTERRAVDLSTTIRYRLSFPPLFVSKLPLLSAKRQELSLYLNHTYTHSSTISAAIATRQITPTKVMHQHSINAFADYTLSDAITVRLYVEQERQQPTVATMIYPYRRTTYGITCMLNLTP